MRLTSPGERSAHVKGARYKLRSQLNNAEGTNRLRSVCVNVERIQSKGKVLLKQG